MFLFKIAILRIKVTVKVTRSLTLKTFETVLFIEYIQWYKHKKETSFKIDRLFLKMGFNLQYGANAHFGYWTLISDPLPNKGWNVMLKLCQNKLKPKGMWKYKCKWYICTKYTWEQYIFNEFYITACLDFYAPAWKVHQGHLVVGLSVCLSVRYSVIPSCLQTKCILKVWVMIQSPNLDCKFLTLHWPHIPLGWGGVKM